MKKRKITKRQRKAANPRNAMVAYSFRHGQNQDYSDRRYYGSQPICDEKWRKVTPGVPFVRVSDGNYRF